MKPIAATLSNFRPVSTRKVVQLILEIPIERATEALMALGGVPDPSNPQWVGIVALNEEPVEEDAIKLFPRIDRTKPIEPPKREWTLANKVAMTCEEVSFLRFLGDCYPGTFRGTGEDVATTVRHLCGVDSRSEITPGSTAGREWDRLSLEYEQWQRGS
jgi:hypothetical protein